jgi:hypothetical protein
MGQPVVSRIAHHAKRTPDRVALVELHRGRETDHDELAQRVRALAWSLQERYGLGQGDRITVLSRNDSRVFEVLCACANLGAIAVPLNWRLTPNELIGIMTDADPGVLIHESWTAPVTSEVAAGAGVPVQVQWSSETSDEDSYEALATAEVPPRGFQTGWRGCGLDDHLHVRYDRAPEGRPGDPPRRAGQHARHSGRAPGRRRLALPHRSANVPRRRIGPFRGGNGRASGGSLSSPTPRRKTGARHASGRYRGQVGREFPMGFL